MVSVFGDVGDAGLEQPPHPQWGDVFTVEQDVSAARLAQAGEDLDQLGLAVAGHPGTPRISPWRRPNDTPFQDVDAAIALDPHVIELEHGLLLRRGAFATGGLDGAADHQLGQLAGAGLGARQVPHHRPFAEYRYGVGDAHHFVELMGDEDDGLAFVRHLIKNLEQRFGLLRGQHAGGFVEDQHLGALNETRCCSPGESRYTLASGLTPRP